MFRLTRQLVKTTQPLFRSVAYASPRIVTVPIGCRPIFQSTRLFKLPSTDPPSAVPPSAVPPTTDTHSADQLLEAEDIEEIDPKDYPELYPDEVDSDEVDTEWFVDPHYTEGTPLSETDFIPLWQRRAIGDHLEDRLALEKVSKELMQSGEITAKTVHDLLVESKMESVQILDIRDKCDWTDYMIIASSSKGDKYLSSIASHVGSVVKQAIRSRSDQSSLPMPHIEGRNDKSGWILVDLGRIIVHLFTPEMRQLYDLEGLWNAVSTDPSEPMANEEEKELP